MLRLKRFLARNLCSVESGKKRNYQRLTSSSKQSHKKEKFEKISSVFFSFWENVLCSNCKFNFGKIFARVKFWFSNFLANKLTINCSIFCYSCIRIQGKYFLVQRYENICSSRMEVNFVATKSESIFRKKISAKNGSIPVKYASVQNCWFELKAAFCIFMHRTYPNSIF